MNTVNHSPKVRRSLKLLVSRPSANMRLLCFPYAGGSAAIFRRWADISADLEFIGAQYRGRDARMRDYPYRSIREFVEEGLADIENFCDKPYAIFGHSMGAMVAFGLAKKLADNVAHKPVHLFLSGLASPRRRVSGKRIYDLPHNDFLCELRNLGGTPPEILENPDILEILLPVIRADFEAAYYWHIDEYCDLMIPTTIFGGMDDRGIPVEELVDWASYTSESVEVNLHPGGHFFIRDEFPAIIESIRCRLFGTPRQSIHECSTHDIVLGSGHSKTLPILKHCRWLQAAPEI